MRGKLSNPTWASGGDFYTAISKTSNRRAFTLLEVLIVGALLLVIMGFSAPALHRMHLRSRLESAAKSLQNELYSTRLLAMQSATPYVFRYQGESGVYEILPKSVYDSFFSEAADSGTDSGLAPARGVGTGVVSFSESLEENAFDSDAGFVEDSVDPMVFGPESPALPQSPPGTPESGDSAGSIGGQYRRTLPNRFVFGAVAVPSRAYGNSDPSTDLPQIQAVGTGPVDFGIGESEQSSKTTSWSPPILFYPNGRTSSGSLEIRNSGEIPYRIEITLRGLTGSAQLGAIQIDD